MSLDTKLVEVLYQAVNPNNNVQDSNAIDEICALLITNDNLHANALKLIGHKIQSPIEKEAMYAINLVYQCTKRCGVKFNQEVGKFKFLNEIIKAVSTKYLGNHTSDNVKTSCIQLLFTWTKQLPEETKILEAYTMLKNQGLVKEEPALFGQPPASLALSSSSTATSAAAPVSPSSDHPPGANSPKAERSSSKKEELFDDEKSKLLARLLKSKNPEDLQAANRLIKSMVRQEEEKREQQAKISQTLETVRNNIQLLGDMLSHYIPNVSSDSDYEIMKELFDQLNSRRDGLINMIHSVDSADSDGLEEILSCNDRLCAVTSRFQEVFLKVPPPSAAAHKPPVVESKPSGTMSELMSVFQEDKPLATSSSGSEAQPLAAMSGSSAPAPSQPAASLLEQQLADLGIGDFSAPPAAESRASASNDLIDFLGASSQVCSPSPRRRRLRAALEPPLQSATSDDATLLLLSLDEEEQRSREKRPAVGGALLNPAVVSKIPAKPLSPAAVRPGDYSHLPSALFTESAGSTAGMAAKKSTAPAGAPAELFKDLDILSTMKPHAATAGGVVQNGK